MIDIYIAGEKKASEKVQMRYSLSQSLILEDGHDRLVREVLRIIEKRKHIEIRKKKSHK